MGDLIPFRRRRKEKKPSDFGRVLPTHRWQGRPAPKTRLWSAMGWLAAWRPWILLALLILTWNTLDPALVEPPRFLSTEPELVEASFTQCGTVASDACVIDGDTFRLGSRSIRVIGIYAPETHPSRCETEARLGQAATDQLLSLLNLGPFEMRGRIDDQFDRYGRELRVLTRSDRDGRETSLGQQMLSSGTVRRYLGGLRSSWC